MKYLLILAVPLVSFFNAFAQKELTTKSKVKNISVYLQGAELTHTANASLPAGSSVLIIQGLPNAINSSTLQVGSKEVLIQSAEYRVSYLQQGQKLPRIKMVEDSLEQLAVMNARLDNARQLANDQIAILLSNKSVGGANTGVSVLELQKLMDYYFVKVGALKNEILEIDGKDKKIQDRINALNNQLNEENVKRSQSTGEVVLQLLASSAKSADFQLSYMVSTAGWNPIYDLRSESVKSPVKLCYKAQVWQNTGLNWDKVKLTINTGNPTEGGTNPVLQPWYINFVQQYTQNFYRKKAYNRPSAAYSTNQVLGSAPAMAEKDNNEAPMMSDYITVNESQLSATFDIDLLYDIPCDGKVHLVSMVEYELPATYEYYAAPKLDKDAFLLARITDWEKLNLLPAMANVFFEGNYVGQSEINPNNTRDTLSLSLGRDKKIVIKRQKIKDYNASKVIGLTKKETYAFDISIRNTKKEAVVINLLDQYPLTQDKDIEVELLENSKAIVDKEKGQLLWKFTLNGSETKSYRMSYSVKYSKDKVIGNMN
jgi:uncharacterized protein (TIGR02231 family)